MNGSGQEARSSIHISDYNQHHPIKSTMSTSASEKQRQLLLERKRSEMMAEYAAQRQSLSSTGNSDPTSEARFVKVTEGMEDRLKKSTVGLVHAEDFKRLREELEEENRRKAARTNELKEESQQANKKRKKNKLAANRLKTLSFGDDEQEEDATTDDATALADGMPRLPHSSYIPNPI